jgi:hypothetical protein
MPAGVGYGSQRMGKDNSHNRGNPESKVSKTGHGGNNINRPTLKVDGKEQRLGHQTRSG